MTSSAIGLWVAGLIAVVDWVAVGRGNEGLERIAKPTVLVAIIASVLLSGVLTSSRGLLLLVALAASLAGDWLLLPPGRFTAGLVAFLAAHLAYLGLFLVGPLHLELGALGLLAALGVLVSVGRGILGGAARVGLGGAVAGYFGAILLMAIAATASGSAVATTGAWLFVTSDAILGWDRFGASPPGSPRADAMRRLAVIVTYHCAQLLLTAAVTVIV